MINTDRMVNIDGSAGSEKEPSMLCPSCQSAESVKNGLMRGLQRYKCKDCGCNYTRSFVHYQDKEKKRRFALSLYMGGLGFHSISRLLGVSHVSVINWVKRYGNQLEHIRNPRPCQVMTFEQIESYMGSNKPSDGFGLVMIEKPEGTFMWLLGADMSEQTERPVKVSTEAAGLNRAETKG